MRAGCSSGAFEDFAVTEADLVEEDGASLVDDEVAQLENHERAEEGGSYDDWETFLMLSPSLLAIESRRRMDESGELGTLVCQESFSGSSIRLCC